MPSSRRAAVPVFPSIDLTDADLAPVVRAARGAGQKSLDVARDATYTAIGLGILGVQRAQVRRRELERALRR
mgnify:FL=1